MAVAQLSLLEDHADLIAAGESGRAGARFDTPPAQFLRTHITILLRTPTRGSTPSCSPTCCSRR